LGKKLVKDAIFATFFRESGAKNLNGEVLKGSGIVSISLSHSTAVYAEFSDVLASEA
jgi:hypothetical protein